MLFLLLLFELYEWLALVEIDDEDAVDDDEVDAGVSACKFPPFTIHGLLVVFTENPLYGLENEEVAAVLGINCEVFALETVAKRLLLCCDGLRLAVCCCCATAAAATK